MAASSLQSPPPISINDDVKLADKFETETKKLQVDRIHDQKLQMREAQRQAVGDNGEGSSKSEEVFRVYFKGLLSEERVNGPTSSNKTVTMAGIGVAICDSTDEMIFEMRKPLDLIEGDRMSRQSVEGQALIEALKAAIALDLKRIVFYCDHHPLYQFVNARWRPKQKKIVNFLDQVNLLRKSFIYCEPSLIAHKDVKFAFKLAREAINSQKSKMESSQEKLENCVICLDDKSVDQFFSIEGCTHRYCYSCIKQHAEVKLLHGMLPKCPHEGCKSELRVESCEKFLTPKLTEMMRQRLKEDSIPVTEKVYCPHPKCSTLMSRTELRGLPKLINEIGAVTCYKCHGNFCINCRVPWHKNMNCAEYKRRNPTQLVEESKLKNLAAKNLWRQCIKCKHMIELAAGCYHITCRCGFEFCYTCGAEWKNKKATCTCPLWDEENIVDNEQEEANWDDDFDVLLHHVVLGHHVVHGHHVVLEDDDFEHDVLRGDVLEDDFEDEVALEDDDFEDEVALEDDDFDDDVALEHDGFEHDDFEHDVVEGDVLEDDYFEHDVALEDGGVFEDDYFEHDVALEDDGVFEDDVALEDDGVLEGDVALEDDGVLEDDYFEDDVAHEDDDVLEDDGALEDGVFGDDDFEHNDVLEDEYGGFEYNDYLEDEYGDFDNDAIQDEYDEFW
ncbi:hypothetical protein L1987_81486 [Smallanthus sonchifolius]|uniref:Uncharacterized protein n=1 Tax=Smallanthus sonchifolius TaxID=185202 RepID=A0ACB8YRP0_9ASTR|nr:hypothetical protein L1987_81486 [Smallanthus sonchifolius]